MIKTEDICLNITFVKMKSPIIIVLEKKVSDIECI